ncbi:hypothetical protein [Pukyongiella litopenaei]|uniref:hypothetical protein n=1 Tax=Pukyongiella litopenaei TaxID=2605946 RepID=UPI001FCF07A9|nr:hypothetical protein [Pukyongiella litopenaei]
MEFVADVLLVAGALGAGCYCFVLARRLNRFNDLEKGVGGAVAVLSAQVDDLSGALVSARKAADVSNDALDDLTGRAEDVAKRLELLLASMHDMPAATGTSRPAAAPAPNPATSEAEQETAAQRETSSDTSENGDIPSASPPAFIRRGAQIGLGQ